MRGEPSDLSNLVVDACHDLRTPLAAAYGFARTIERMGGVTGDNAMYLRQVIEATEELEQLIKALSAVAHSERGTLRLRPEPVDLGELTLQAAELSGHPLERDVSAGLVETDAGRAVTSLAWLAAPIAEAQGDADRAWHIVGATPSASARSRATTGSCSSGICAPTRASGCSSSRARRSRSATTA